MIRLIGLDMDGTLLNDNKNISFENKEALAKAIELGIKIVLVTGRPLCNRVLKYYQELNLYKDNEYMIAFNGAAIYNIFTKELIYDKRITGKDVKDLKKFAYQFNGAYIHLYKDNDCYYEDINEYTEIERNVNKVSLFEKNFDEFKDEDKIIKFMIVGHESVLNEVENNIPLDLKNRFTILRSMPYFLEFINKDVNKYVGLKFLSKKLNINEDEIMTFGDAMNDYDMIKNAKLSVAMGNAVDELKEVAKFVTKENNESGVAHAINMFIIDK